MLDEAVREDTCKHDREPVRRVQPAIGPLPPGRHQRSHGSASRTRFDLQLKPSAWTFSPISIRDQPVIIVGCITFCARLTKAIFEFAETTWISLRISP